MIPTRDEIGNKLKELRSDSEVFNVYDSMSQWLDKQKLPDTIIVAGNTINPKEQILSDLDSYA